MLFACFLQTLLGPEILGSSCEVLAPRNARLLEKVRVAAKASGDESKTFRDERALQDQLRSKALEFCDDHDLRRALQETCDE